MTKEHILEYYKDINHYYNDCGRYEDLSQMLDKLIVSVTEPMNDKWEELRETIQEIHDSNAEKYDVITVTQFLLNLMDVLDGKKTE